MVSKKFLARILDSDIGKTSGGHSKYLPAPYPALRMIGLLMAWPTLLQECLMISMIHSLHLTLNLFSYMKLHTKPTSQIIRKSRNCGNVRNIHKFPKDETIEVWRGLLRDFQFSNKRNFLETINTWSHA